MFEKKCKISICPSNYTRRIAHPVYLQGSEYSVCLFCTLLKYERAGNACPSFNVVALSLLQVLLAMDRCSISHHLLLT